MPPSEYSPSLWTALERTLSKGRLIYYRDLAREKTHPKSEEDEKQDAFQLLIWNTQLSESLYLPLQVFEITLRNRMDTRISACYTQQAGTTEWYKDAAWLKTWFAADDRGDITAAFKSGKTDRLDHSTDHDHSIAATTLGFWVNLLNRKYGRFWSEVLEKAFWPGVNRDALYKLASKCNYIRNQMAHYEPVINKRRPLELVQLHKDILHFISRACPQTGNWVRENSQGRFDNAWKAKPGCWPPVIRK
jgi:hypothetical protein